jgi:hypothetical protein
MILKGLTVVAVLDSIVTLIARSLAIAEADVR